ncbi:MAG: c-type cytochrome [Sciscionella sp.]
MKLRGSVSLIGIFVIGVSLSSSSIAGNAPSDAAAGAQRPTSNDMEPPSTAASIAAGNQTYHKSCAGCHGQQAQGGAAYEGMPVAPPGLTAPNLRLAANDREMFNVIKQGIPPDYYMMPFKGMLTDAQIWNVVHYIDSLRAKRPTQGK